LKRKVQKPVEAETFACTVHYHWKARAEEDVKKAAADKIVADKIAADKKAAADKIAAEEKKA